MKQFLLILLSNIFLVIGVGAIQVDEELLVNGNFEQGLERWQVRTGAQSNEEASSTALITNLNGILFMNATVPNVDGYIHEAKAVQCVALGDGVKFTLKAMFQFYALSEVKYTHRVSLVWHEKSDCRGGGQFGGYIEPKNILGWQKLHQDNFIPALNAKSASIEVTQLRQLSMTSGYWDNISFVAKQLAGVNQVDFKEVACARVPINANLLANSSFENDASNWHPDQRYKWIGDDGDGQIGAVSVTLQSDTGSMGTGVLDQCVAIAGRNRFMAGASFKSLASSTQKGGGRLRVTWYENEGCKGRHKTDTRDADPLDISGWQRLKIPLLEAPVGVKSAKIEAIQTILGQGVFTALWDDFYFEAILE